MDQWKRYDTVILYVAIYSQLYEVCNLTYVQVKVSGKVYAGKKIHKSLLDAENTGVENIARKYIQECQLMSDLHHPNITLFFGINFVSFPTANSLYW